jgi:hypothetical protein
VKHKDPLNRRDNPYRSEVANTVLLVFHVVTWILIANLLLALYLALTF